MVAKIVFNTDNLNDDVFKIFSEANNIEAFSDPNFKINPKTYESYKNILNYYINNPNPNSLIDICLQVSNNKEEVFHQIPHFIFPIVGLFITTIPRLLIILFNHKNILNQFIQDVNSINPKDIYKLSYLRNCILEVFE